jgi:hypothetical protein
MMDNVTHMHLLLNHFPTIGMIIGVGLLALAFVRRSDHLKAASLEVFFIISLLTLPAYLTGKAAHEALQGRAGVSESIIATHENAAFIGLVFMLLTGTAAWAALWQARRTAAPRTLSTLGVLVMAVATLGVMSYAANVGGEIHHDEIRVAEIADAGAEPAAVGVVAWLSTFVNERVWVWPAAETVHFMGLCLVFGILLVVNVRLLGMMRRVSFAAVHRLLPWAMVGFFVNALTGMLFFVAAPGQYTRNPAFFWKVGFMLLAGLNLLYLTVVDEAWMVRSEQEAPLREKLVAASAIFLWIGVIYWGRMLPFIGNAF